MSNTRTRTVGVIGAGTMGSDIALSAALGGFELRLYDLAPAARAAALDKIAKALVRSVDKGRLTRQQADAVLARVRPVGELAGLGGCDVIVEAIVEIFEAKAALFSALNDIVDEHTLIATNTSSLRVSDLARHLGNPQRCIGLHYFFPASVNPLLEVIRGEATSEAAVEQALEFAQRSGKTPILCRDVFGFAVNRYFVPYLNEAARLAGEGFEPAAIEFCAIEEFKASVGPFKVMDLTKTLIAVHAARTLSQHGSFYRPSAELIARGESNAPWAVTPSPAPQAARYQVIRQRLLGAVLLPVLQALDEDVARPEDFDLGAKLALQWGRQPCELMDALGRERVTTILEPLLAAHATPMPAAIQRVGRLRAMH